MNDVPHFSPRQLELLRALCTPGPESLKEIAFGMNLTYGSMKVLLSKIYSALGWKGSCLRSLILWALVNREALGIAWPGEVHPVPAVQFPARHCRCDCGAVFITHTTLERVKR